MIVINGKNIDDCLTKLGMSDDFKNAIKSALRHDPKRHFHPCEPTGVRFMYDDKIFELNTDYGKIYVEVQDKNYNTIDKAEIYIFTVHYPDLSLETFYLMTNNEMFRLVDLDLWRYIVNDALTGEEIYNSSIEERLGGMDQCDVTVVEPYISIRNTPIKFMARIYAPFLKFSEITGNLVDERGGNYGHG